MGNYYLSDTKKIKVAVNVNYTPTSTINYSNNIISSASSSFARETSPNNPNSFDNFIVSENKNTGGGNIFNPNNITDLQKVIGGKAKNITVRI